MPKCKTCRYARIGLVDPMDGYCIFGVKEIDSDSATISVKSMAVPGKRINLRDEACEHFEKKGSHADFIKESN
ncbi:hypothetical protein [Desulfosarcina ovata]|uniref:Uncharacterized protein n=1 Tax=Desulfosarcina ovata subsp. ovata TaxID=2752305 RepID=A0A5K8A6R2_9BACT|nr:hypothetical protein [Desulfosarcina ovata]BBO88136.1 hypothetical protein DSCOOX_13160 [Desulfosarcina ovata subsp. ovata]